MKEFPAPQAVVPSLPEYAVQVSPWRMRLVRATAVIMGASGLLSCTSGQEAGPRQDTYSYDVPAPDPLQSELATPPSSSAPAPAPNARTCWPFADPKAITQQKHAEAPGCIGTMENGRAAFITFGPSTKRIEGIAEGIERHMAVVSMNTISLSLDVVPASKEAMAAVQKTTKGKCVDTSNAAKLTSVAADNTMPELKKYDFVISAVPLPDCHGNFGVAIKGGRHADIFINTIDKEFANQNFPPEKADTVAVAATAHETGHLYTLGHAGSVLGRQEDGSYANLSANIPAGTFDLKRYLKTALLQEYISSPDDERGEGDPMGYNRRTVGQQFNIVHMDDLTAPRETLYGDQASPSEHVGTQWTTFTAEEAAAGQFGRVDLKIPVKLKGVKGEIEYDGIAVVPQGYGEPYLHGVELYLTNAGNDVATLGALGILDGASSKAWTLQYGGQKIEIQLNSGRLRVRTLSR